MSLDGVLILSFLRVVNMCAQNGDGFPRRMPSGEVRFNNSLSSKNLRFCECLLRCRMMDSCGEPLLVLFLYIHRHFDYFDLVWLLETNSGSTIFTIANCNSKDAGASGLSIVIRVFATAFLMRDSANDLLAIYI